jgi:peptidylprolyl isomerase
MTPAKHGDSVEVHYRILLADGSVFDSTLQREPIRFEIGQDERHRAFEEALVGMDVGESKTVNLSSSQAFGPYLQEKVIEVERDRVEVDGDLYKGQTLKMMGCSRRAIIVKVVDFSELSVTLDTNHPLAGKDITLDIRLVKIIPET